MRELRILLCSLAIGVIVAQAVWAGSAGSFRGKVVQNEQATPDPDWIYIQGKNKMVRRVEISHARIEYDAEVPPTKRKMEPHQALIVGAEVRVTAEQGADGEWRASLIEILNSSLEGKSAANSTKT